MSDATHTAAFRIVGSCTGERRRVHGPTAYAAYARCDARANVTSEAYLSAFWFHEADFRRHLEAHGGSTAGYASAAWSPWLTFDIDRNGNAEAALADTRTLVGTMVEGLGIPLEAITTHWSGHKGFAVELLTGLWRPAASVAFPDIAREFAEGIARLAGVAIDPMVYGRVQPLRAPNSRHPKSGLCKRRIDAGIVLDGITARAVLDLAKTPEAFDPATADGLAQSDLLVASWREAAKAVEARRATADQRRAEVAAGTRAATLNRRTRDFLAGDIIEGERQRMLYSAARNLTEIGCPPHAVRELLTEPARDLGLPPAEIERTIRCGVEAR